MDAPAQLGRYALLRPFGGAPGRYLAFDATLDRTLLLETLDVSADADAEPALRRARAFAAIDHPAFATIHDISVVEDRVVLAREHIEGRPLATWCRCGEGSKAIVDVVVQVGWALHALHAADLFVGNLSADGIVIGDDGRASITGPVLEPIDGSAAADRVALCAILADGLRAAKLSPPKHLADLDASRFASTDDLVRWLARDPARNRRRALVVLGGVAVASIAIVTYSQAKQATLLVCRGADRKLAGIWDDDVSMRLHAAFEATAAPFASHVAESLDGVLDAYGGEWTQAHTVACEDTRVRGHDEIELDARMRCLEGKLDAVTALVGVLEQADETVVRNAVTAAQALEPASSCLDPRASEGEESEDERQLRRELARAVAQEGAGKYKDALVTARAVLQAAESRRHEGLAVEALRVIGMLQWRLGEAHSADETLEDCIGRAWTANRDDIAAFAWSQLVFVRAEMLGDFPAAHRAARHAEATLTRIGDDPALEGAIDQSRGTLAQREGRYADAIADYEAALAAYRRAGSDETRLAGALTNLANAQISADRLDDALANQGKALAARRRILGEDHPDTAHARETLAAILHRRGDSEDALAELRRVHEIRARALGAHHPFTLKSLANVGALLTDVGRWDEADRTLTEALDQTRRFVAPDDPNVFFLLVNLALVARERGDHAAALRHCEDAAKLYVATPDHPEAAAAIHCQGRALVDLGRSIEGIARLRRALDIRERKLGLEHELVARSLSELAAALLNHPGSAAVRDEALSMLRRSLEIHRLRGSPAALIAPVRERLDAAVGSPIAAVDRKPPDRGTGEGETP